MPELLLSLNLLTSWTLHILYNMSHWQLRILSPPPPPLDVKNCHCGATAPIHSPPPRPPRHWLSVGHVSQLCLFLALLLKCRVQKLGLDSRPLVLFGQFVLFWRNYQAKFQPIRVRCRRYYFQFARSVPSCIPLFKSF